jgi:hypothetical protein
MLQYYVTQGYGVVQVAWSSPWQAIYQQQPPIAANVQYGACRPATFLNFIYNTYYQPITQGTGGNASAGMCAQGFSAGSAAIAYSMAYYGVGSFLDNVELISGPVLSDIEQGCEVPQPSAVTVCPPGSSWCNLGPGGSSWALSPTYLGFDAGYIRSWTNDSSCAGSANTSGSANALWHNQSIVDGSTGGSVPVPIFSYPNTAMAGWLCRSVNNPPPINCSLGYIYDYCPNNSSPQGQLFYAQVGAASPPPVFNVYAVDACMGPEGAPQGGVGSSTGTLGQTAIQQDMAGTPALPIGQCQHRSHTQ